MPDEQPSQPTTDTISPRVGRLEAAVGRVLGLQTLDDLTGEEPVAARSTQSNNCAYSGLSTGGCHIVANPPRPNS
jgi:hypothetical protein